MSENALLLIDIQNDYFSEGSWPVENMETASDNAASILGHARKAGDMIVHIRHEIPSDGAPFFQPGTTGAETHSSVAPVGDESVILKHRPNSFHETDLLQRLLEQRIKNVTIVGAMSQMCIDATTRAAADFGFGVTVIADACAAKEVRFGDQLVPASHVHATIMGALAGIYAQVVTCEAYLSAQG